MQSLDPLLPFDIVDLVIDHLAKEATRQRPLLDDHELASYKIYLTTLLRLGATCQALQLSSRRALWRSVDLDVSPRPQPALVDQESDAQDSIRISAVFPFDIALPLWSMSPSSGGSGLVLVPSSATAFSLPVEHVRKLSVLVYSSSRPGVQWQFSTLMSLLGRFPGPLRSVHIHGVTLPNSALTQILTHLSAHLATFTLSQHGKVVFDPSTDQHLDERNDWVYDLNHITLPVLERMYFEAWLSLPDNNFSQHTQPSVQVKSLPTMPAATTVNVKARTVSSHLACTAAYPNMFFWVKRWLPSPDSHPPAGAYQRLRHLGVFIEKDPFPFDSLPPLALAAIRHLHVKAVVLTRALPFALLNMASMPGLRDLTLTNFFAVALAHVPWTLMPNLEALALAGDAENVDPVVLFCDGHDLGGQGLAAYGWVVAKVELPHLRTLTVSHRQLVHSRSARLRFHCPRLTRLVVGFDDWLPEIVPEPVLGQVSVETYRP